MLNVSLTTLLQAVLVIAYPVCCHFAVTLDQPKLQLLAILLLGLGLTFRGLRAGSGASWFALGVIVLLAALVSVFGVSRWVLYLPPVALPLLLWSTFYRTLGSGQTPLVTAIALAAHGELSAELRAYTRASTALWAVLFGGLAITSAILPFVASEQTWSLFTNFLAWLIIGVLFLAEFIYRQWRFPSVEHVNFREYLRLVIQADVRNIR